MTRHPDRRRKYGNEPVTVDGERFDSRAEAARWSELRLMERAGQVFDLRRQVRIPLHATAPDGAPVLVGHYVADMAYIRADTGARVLEDEKGQTRTTDLYRWKARHVRAQYGLEIVEIRRGRATR